MKYSEKRLKAVSDYVKSRSTVMDGKQVVVIDDPVVFALQIVQRLLDVLRPKKTYNKKK